MATRVAATASVTLRGTECDACMFFRFSRGCAEGSSGSAWGGRLNTPSGSVTDAPDSLAAVGDDDADQQQDTDDDVLHLGLDVHLGEGLLQSADDGHREHDTEMGPRPPKMDTPPKRKKATT